ncbi:MAG: cation:dicarboxylase symporter family transporter [Pseudomonadales bacterium]|jgi:Na+/H+-dicarboxylate symporter|nr:cation:dicarboxylase symporter family transporter [Pseudomonadales bacterium]MBL6817703.1 cation:dicarboxylase symporter family transporter [Pseudomonadales bacterium]
MNLSFRILTGLLLGSIAGLMISRSNAALFVNLPGLLAPLGSLWVNAIRMTIMPLLMALVVVAIAGQGRSGRVLAIGGKTLSLLVGLILLSSLFALLFAAPLIGLLEISSENSNVVLASSQVTAERAPLPPFKDWLIGLIPANPFAAAANGDILPLMIFTVVFSLALIQIDERLAKNVVTFFEATKQALLVVIAWIMELAPYGIFALVLPITANLGTESVRLLGTFILMVCGLIVLLSACIYLGLWVLGHDIKKFAKTMAPVQVIGFGTRSSLATLPATIAASEILGVSQKTAGLVLPAAVTLFKFASPLARTAGTYFIAALYGIDLTVSEFVVIALAVGLLSFYSPGIPSGGLLIMTPVYLALGLPVEGIGLLIAIDLIVDMFITAANVTANMGVTMMLDGLRET